LIRRVLVVQPYGLGDMLFITPVLRALRLIPSVERVDLLIGSRTQEIIASNPHVNDIYVIDKDKMHKNSRQENISFLKSLGKSLKPHRYDLLIDYSIRGEYAFFSQFFLGVSKRAGYAYKKRGFFHNIRVPISNGFEGKHVVDFACDLAEAAGVPVKERFVEFFFSENQQVTLKSVLNPILPENYLAVSLGGGESWGKDAHLKRWPVARFVELLKYLMQKTGAQKIVLVGSTGEKELAEEFLKSGLSTDNWVGKLSITETAWLLKKSKLFLGNDGGLLHLARAVFKPVIGIYGPADPKVYGPYGNSDQGSAVSCQQSVAIYKPPADGKPRYFKFRYNPNDTSLQDLSVEEAVRQIEDSGLF